MQPPSNQILSRVEENKVVQHKTAENPSGWTVLSRLCSSPVLSSYLLIHTGFLDPPPFCTQTQPASSPLKIWKISREHLTKEALMEFTVHSKVTVFSKSSWRGLFVDAGFLILMNIICKNPYSCRILQPDLHFSRRSGERDEVPSCHESPEGHRSRA